MDVFMKYLKLTSKDRKTGAEKFYYQFRSYNVKNQRFEPVPVNSLPKYIRECQSDEVAQKYADLKSSEENAIKARVQKRLDWQNKFQGFDKMLEEFAKEHKKKAPNSWGNDVYYLEAYVFSFFLGKQLSNNIPEWPLHYKEFRNWLSAVKPLKYKAGTLAINTQNKIIKSLNLFLSFYGDENPTEYLIKKCPVYPKSMCRQSTAEDVLDENEILIIWEALKIINPRSADFFYLLTKTGMRLHEGLGICVHFINPGPMEGNKIGNHHELITEYGLSYEGYICLESQPSSRRLRDASGHVPRKPLKKRPEISPKYFRYIPIFDKEAWKIIARLYDAQLDQLDSKKWGKDEKDYLLFEGLSSSKFYQDLRKAFETTKLKFRSPHKVGRHTFLTWLYGATRDDAKIAEIIAGHRDKATIENYGHLSEQIGREQLKKKNGRKRLSKAA
jgi:integrase